MTIRRIRRTMIDISTKADSNNANLTGITQAENLKVTDSAQFTQNTTIGDVTAKEIEYIHGVTSNIQNQLDSKVGTTELELLKDNAPSDGDTLRKLRNLISGIQTILNSDDVNLDSLQEIVNYIKNNKSILDGVTTSKLNVSDVIDDLVHTDIDKPLSAKQGKILKDLFDSFSIPMASKTADGLMSKADFAKLEYIEPNAQVNFGGEDAKLALPDYFRKRTIVFVLADKQLNTGVQNIILQFPFNGKITDIRGVCRTAGTDYTDISIEKTSQVDYLNQVYNAWSSILTTNGGVIFQANKAVSDSPVIADFNVVTGDFFRLNINHLSTDIKNITIEIDVEI